MRIKGPGKRVTIEEPEVEVDIFPDGSQRDGHGRWRVKSSPEESRSPIHTEGGLAMRPFGVRRPPAGVLVDGDGEVGVSDLIAGELLSDDLNTLDYYDMYPMRQMLRRVHVQDRRQMWVPTDRVRSVSQSRSTPPNPVEVIFLPRARPSSEAQPTPPDPPRETMAPAAPLGGPWWSFPQVSGWQCHI